MQFTPSRIAGTLRITTRHLSSGLRNFTSIRRGHPYVFTALPSDRIQVELAPNTVPLGTFPSKLKDELTPGFTLEPNPRTEPEILIPKPSLFEENPEFWPLASSILKKHIHLDPVYSDLVAAETKTPYFHIYDFRLPPTFGRIPEVEDILGTVELVQTPEVTKIVPGSFEPNSMYRPITQYGAMLVSPPMYGILANELARSRK